MSRILLKGSEETVPLVAVASSFSEATVVRLVNTTSDARLVTVAENNGGSATIGTFTILGSTSELLEKNPTDVVFVDSGTNVKGAKVGFTN